jgi:adenosylhomocysteine nucleosidase
MKIAVTAALSMEFSTFKRCMGRVQKLPLGAWVHYIWKHNGNQVILLETGIGPKQASEAVHSLLQIHKVDCLINFGSAGMIDESLNIGDPFLVDEISDAESGETVSTNYQIVDAISQFFIDKQIKYARGHLVTSPKPIASRSSRTRLADTFNGGAVDMEAFAIAKIAQEENIPFAAIKMISDRANAMTRLQFWKNVSQVDKQLGKLMYGFIDFLKAA